MPALNRVMAGRELRRMIQLYLKAETGIINEIGRLRSLGLVDYHAEAALARVQAILGRLEREGWEYVPKMIEHNFYVHHPEARKPSARSETAEKHERGYLNAEALTGEQTDVVNRLVMNLMGQLAEAHATAYASLSAALIGRVEPDIFRRVGLEQTGLAQAMGRGPFRATPDFVEALRREGVTAFVDKAGRHWSLHTYASMVLRTTSRQAEVLSVLTQDPEWDLFKISKHGTTCKRCAPYEGRVYSKSGTSPDFPPLSAAFGKIDPSGPDTLDNSWLNLHPNCLHQILRWSPMGRSEEEIRKIKDFSSFEKNPPAVDPRTEKQIDAYRKKEQARARRLADYRQWERYRAALGDGVPKSFDTFLKHKYAVKDPETGKHFGDETFSGWKQEYRRRNSTNAWPAPSLTAEGQRGKVEAVRAIIRSEKTPKQLNIGHQNKHIKNSSQYVPGKSYLYGSLETAQDLVYRFHGTGEPIFTRKGDWAKKEVVIQDDVVGVNIDIQTGAESETRRFTIHYGKNGTHVVPAKEKTQ